MKRSKLPQGQSQRMFTRTAKRVHPKNNIGTIPRGGIRL